MNGIQTKTGKSMPGMEATLQQVLRSTITHQILHTCEQGQPQA